MTFINTNSKEKSWFPWSVGEHNHDGEALLDFFAQVRHGQQRRTPKDDGSFLESKLVF